MLGVAVCEEAGPLIERALREGWSLDPERITRPVRVLWGSDDKLLAWPSAAARGLYELDGVGHCP
jgi:pimeloyl-ACP methyl ester carboxylesterase